MTIIIGLSGKAGSGKGTFAQRLVDKHGFTRLAFADPLKEILRRTDPIVRVYHDGETEHLSELLADPKKYPEYRRLLQALGTACREVIDQSIWIDLLTYEMLDRRAHGADRFVITDVRMENEAEWVRWTTAGLLLRIVRPNAAGLGGALDAHRSEWDLDAVQIREVLNDGTIDDLWTKADLIAEALIEKEEC